MNLDIRIENFIEFGNSAGWLQLYHEQSDDIERIGYLTKNGDLMEFEVEEHGKSILKNHIIVIANYY